VKSILRLAFLFLTVLCGTARAQLALFSFDGATETPVGTIYNLGSAPSGSNHDARFRVHNTGVTPITISTIAVSGSGFSILAVNGLLPYITAPANFLEFTIRFAAATPANYSANLQVNSIAVLLLASSVPPPSLTVVSGCAIAAPGTAQAAFDFGNVAIGTPHICTFSLFNPTLQPMLISSITLTGGFQFQQNPATPLTLAANAATPLMVAITPVCGTASYAGSLIVNGQAFPLTAAGIAPPLPKPLLTFDTRAFSSGEQHTVSLSLPTTSPCGATGNLNLAFASNVPGVASDSAVVFLPGNTRSLQFAVAANSTAITIGGQSAVTFQTGTTSGSITFALTGTPLAADPTTTIVISPSTIAIDTVTASNQRLGELDIEVIGFDNTYSAGKMAFTFFDTAGNQVGSSVAADFSTQFKTYFGTQTTGSAFLMRVSFPVIGDQTKIGKVQATLTNSAGSAQTGPLTFQ
jgi:hypothetical protein